MPAPSQLSIATSAVIRLSKEESSYHQELEQQKVRIAKLEASNGDEYEIKQEKQALEETHKVFPSLHIKIRDAVAKLEAQVREQGSEASSEEITKAREAIAAGQAAVKESA
ncbi:hypothetical protein CAC42_2984 [Sphaceloma murrayae]|uniref:Tubulin-specific chaperone A n=1 Tax=Sphaceloma murrayae TaxID=2082308 RepID=A0A2K1R0B6_9PEZI|nr:hypothetical protein CAC42_2984 [Sphaceloma murrayae]